MKHILPKTTINKSNTDKKVNTPKNSNKKQFNFTKTTKNSN